MFNVIYKSDPSVEKRGKRVVKFISRSLFHIALDPPGFHDFIGTQRWERLVTDKIDQRPAPICQVKHPVGIVCLILWH